MVAHLNYTDTKDYFIDDLWHIFRYFLYTTSLNFLVQVNQQGRFTLTRIIRANCSREQFARTRIHTDASYQVARQNTLTSFLTFITDSVYRFIVFIDLVMLFRQKSHRLDLCMLKRSKRWSFLLLSCRRFGGRKGKFVHDINEAKQGKAKLKNGVRQCLCAYRMCIT